MHTNLSKVTSGGYTPGVTSGGYTPGVTSDAQPPSKWWVGRVCGSRAIAVIVGRVLIYSFKVFEFSFVPEVSV